MAAWGNTLGLYSLLSLIPFIILYLIRPKPKEIDIPSLMFFYKQRGTKQYRSFLRNFIQDLLFLIQLLILLALCFSLAEPLIKVVSSYTVEETVLVLDNSASMSAGGRFEKAIDIAKKNLGKRTSIVLAADIPITILESADVTAAQQVLNKLSVSGTNTNIGDAMKTAGEKIEVGRVVVVSDFLYNKGLDPVVAKSLLESKGLSVDFYSVDGGTKNFAFTKIDLTFDKARIYVKNYNDKKETVKVKVGDLNKELIIEPKSIETFAIKAPPGITKAEILTKDDMPADNAAYINIPELRKTKVLLVTNNEKNFLKAALSALPTVDLQIAIPPIIPSIDHEVVIFSQVNTQKILPGTFEEIEKRVREGGSVVYTGQENMPIASTLPFKKAALSKQSGKISIEVLNQLTKGIEFGRVDVYNKGHADNGSVTLLSTETLDPLLVVKEYGKGYGIYYGLFDDVSDFKLSPSYPIFWNSLLRFLTGERDLTRYNKKTGDIIALGSQQQIETPQGTLLAKTLLIDEIGVYKLPQYYVVGNLLNEQESDILAESGSSPITKVLEDGGTQTRNESLTKYLAWFALVLILFEVFYVKYRGDL